MLTLTTRSSMHSEVVHYSPTSLSSSDTGIADYYYGPSVDGEYVSRTHSTL